MPLWHISCFGTEIENIGLKQQNVKLKIMEDKTMLPTIARRSFRPFYMPSIFDDDFLPVMTSSTSSMPAVNIREDEKRFILDLAVPGIDKKDLNIDVNEDLLTISSETKNELEDNRDGYKRKEFSYSSFCRSFQIPENVSKDKIEANYRDGILSVALPKIEEDKRKISRQVKIS
jgi:HSP20 family protein